jgi:hypothetical protein
MQTNLATVDPGCWSEAEGVAHGVDEDEDDADDIGRLADILGISEGKSAVDLFRLVRNTCTHHISYRDGQLNLPA